MLPWKKLHSSSDNPLAAAAAHIAQKHELPDEGVCDLGKALVYPLSEKFMVLGLLKPLYQEKQGKSRRSELLTLLKRASRDLNRVHEIARHLHSLDLPTATAYEQLRGARTLSYNSELDLYRKMIEARTGKGATWDTAAINRRKKLDEIKPVVLAILFEFWTAHSRPLTVTTTNRAKNERRAGKLLAFANDVIMQLTDPPTQIKGETFRKGLDEYKADVEMGHLVVRDWPKPV